MLLNKEDIKKIISDSNKDCLSVTGLSQESIDRVFKRMSDKLESMSLEQLIDKLNKQNNIKLRIFAPGLYFIPDKITRYSCQIR